MPNTNVTSRWECGDLVFKDKCLNDIFAIDGTNRHLTTKAPVSAQNTHGAFTETYLFETCGCGTESKSITVANKIRVTDFQVVLKGCGAACDTAQLFNACTAISDALDISGSDKAIVRAGTIDDAQHEVAACGTLKLTVTDAAGCNAPAVIGYVTAVRVA